MSILRRLRNSQLFYINLFSTIVKQPVLYHSRLYLPRTTGQAEKICTVGHFEGTAQGSQ